ncbi:MAG: MBL fold metallo-hydrolase [Eubacterium sp.]|nr:MBL fold metallo-hydrolase [Eubacterium sp.]
MSVVTLLKYSNTNTYLIEGSGGSILFDTGWAGTFGDFCKALGETGKKLQDISYIMISHFHPDHMGIAQDIADHGPVIVAVDIQKAYLHAADEIFAKDKRTTFRPIIDEEVRVISLNESRGLLESIGLIGEIVYTPGHSDDSISLWLDEGLLFVGDLNPLYELELHKGTVIGESWEKLLGLGPKKVYYGHAKPVEMADSGVNAESGFEEISGLTNRDMYLLVSRIIKYIDRGYSIEKIERKTGADSIFIEDVNRMYLTHRNVGVQGILDRIEIKNR